MPVIDVTSAGVERQIAKVYDVTSAGVEKEIAQIFDVNLREVATLIWENGD